MFDPILRHTGFGKVLTTQMQRVQFGQREMGSNGR